MKETLKKQAMILRLMREQLRETNRLNIHRILGLRHDNSDWPFEVKKEIAAFVNKVGVLAFLKELGYERRGPKRMRHPHDDELPEIVIKDPFDFFADVPAEVVNTAWMMSRMKKFNAVQKANNTKRLKRLQADVAESQEKRARLVDETPPPDTNDEDEWSLGGF